MTTIADSRLSMYINKFLLSPNRRHFESLVRKRIELSLDEDSRFQAGRLLLHY